MFRAIFFSILCCSILFHSWSQEYYQLSFGDFNSESLKRLENKTFSSKEKAFKALDNLELKIIKKGYVLASVDSVKWNGTLGTVFFYQGPKFNNLQIQVRPKDNYLIRQVSGISERSLNNLELSSQDIGGVMSKISAYLENHGYPFAKVYLELDQVNKQGTSAELIVDKGPIMKISEVHIKGDAKISSKYVENVIGIKKEDLYDESRLAKISSLIEQVIFLNEIKPHEVLFTPQGAEVFLYLKSNPVSLLNGVVGIQPDPVTGNNVVTGDVRLKLQNILNRGELLDINWRSLQPQTTDLRTHLNYPFLFSTPFGVEGKFDLYQRDSTFLSTNINLGVQYFLRGGNHFKVFFEAHNSNLLSGSSNVSNTNSSGLPSNDLASVSANQYGVGIYRRQIDYLPNPSKGLTMEIDGLIGRRTSRLLDMDTSILSTTFSLRSDINWFFPVAKRHVIRIANRTRLYYAPTIFVNELFRFGGLMTQRGFDEEELFASSLNTTTIEYRFLVDKNSHAFLFYDQTFYESNAENYYKDSPFGVGAGFSFGTKIGVFSISYGIGKQFDNPMLLRNGKVHFGYVSYF
jgi:outer membrane protein assembly factor BamA